MKSPTDWPTETGRDGVVTSGLWSGFICGHDSMKAKPHVGEVNGVLSCV